MRRATDAVCPRQDHESFIAFATIRVVGLMIAISKNFSRNPYTVQAGFGDGVLDRAIGPHSAHKRIDSGQHLVYGEDSPVANLYVSMLDAFGAPVERFADSTRALEGLLC